MPNFFQLMMMMMDGREFRSVERVVHVRADNLSIVE
jgi:hypothetical protein